MVDGTLDAGSRGADVELRSRADPGALRSPRLLTASVRRTKELLLFAGRATGATIVALKNRQDTVARRRVDRHRDDR